MRVRYDIHEDFFDTSRPAEERRFKIIEEELLKYIRDRGAIVVKEFESKQAFSIELNHPKMLNALVDAFLDIRRVEDFQFINNGPDQVKFASHIVFWFLRWQPCMIVPQDDFLLSDKLTKKEKKKLLLINETLMLTYLQTSVFMGGSKCSAAPHNSMAEWEGYYDYLFYYLTYRLRSPKELEAMLKTTTLHPLWPVQQDIHFGKKDEANNAKLREDIHC